MTEDSDQEFSPAREQVAKLEFTDNQKLTRTKASEELAKLFACGIVPVSASTILLQVINRVTVPDIAIGQQASSKPASKVKTVPQLVNYLKDIGHSLSIETIEEVTAVVTALESEVDADMDVICGVLLYLVEKSKDTPKHRRVTNFLMNFISSSDRTDLALMVVTHLKAPIYSGPSLPSMEKVHFADQEWSLMFQGLMTIICQQDPFSALENAKSEWRSLKQKGSIEDYVYSESQVWSKLVTHHHFLQIQPPSDPQRVENLLANLNPESKRLMAKQLRFDGRRSETLSYQETIMILNVIQDRQSIQFTWELNGLDQKKSVRFASPITQNPMSKPKTTSCPHCGRWDVRHAPEDCFMNPTNKRSNPERTKFKEDGIMANSPTSTNRNGTPRSHFADARSQRTDSEPSPRARANSLSPRAAGHQQRDRDGNIPSFAIATNIGPTFGARALCNGNTQINIAFDTYSSITIIREDLCHPSDLSPGAPKLLSGVGGQATISGTTGTALIEVKGGRFRINGYIGRTPRGVDILIGTPQMLNMELQLSYRGSQPTAVIPVLDNLTIPLSKIDDLIPIQVHETTVKPMELPKLNLLIDENATMIPFQVRSAYDIPSSLQRSVESQILKEIKLGHLKYVDYDPKQWISPMFVKSKGKIDESTGLPAVRILADLRHLNSHLSHPIYWSQQCANLSTFPDFVELGEDVHFCKIDIENAYHTCEVHPSCQHLLVIRYNNKLLQYLTCPQGLASSALFWPQHLAAGFNQILGSKWQTVTSIFVDDILIYGKTKSECEKNTLMIIGALESMGKTLSTKSVLTPQREMECVGLLFTHHGVRLSEEAVSKLKRCLESTPKTTKDMRRMIGGIMYASNAFDFKDRPSLFGSLMQPLHRSVSAKPFKLTPEIESSLAELKNRISNTEMTYSNPKTLLSEGQTLVIMTDASDKGVGACLFRCQCSAEQVINNPELIQNKGALISLDSHTLSKAEQKWHTFELESYALYRAVIKWRGLLIAATSRFSDSSETRVVICTDSRTNLGRFSRPEKIQATSAKSKRFSGWALETSFLKLLPVKLAFATGEANCLADMFSRIATELRDHPKDSESEETDIEIWAVDDLTPAHLPLEKDTVHTIANAQKRDEETTISNLRLADIYAFLSSGECHPSLRAKLSGTCHGRFFLLFHPADDQEENPLIYTRSSFQITDEDEESTQRGVLVIPQISSEQGLLSTAKPLFTRGLSLKDEMLLWSHQGQAHAGVSQTGKFIRNLCWWPGMLRDITQYIQNCKECDRPNRRASGYSVIGSERLSRIQVDHKKLPEQTAARTTYCAILSAVDTLTGYACIAPVKSLSGPETAHAILTNWIKYFGIPRIIQTDNSTSFSNLTGQPNETMGELCRLMGSKMVFISTYNPTANGKVERFHRELNRWLQTFESHMTCNPSVEHYLALAQMNINSNSDAYVLTFGKDPSTLSHALSQKFAKPISELHENGSIEYDQELISELRKVAVDNQEWHAMKLDERSRENASYIQSREARARRATLTFAVGNVVSYENRLWVIERIATGSTSNIPTVAWIRPQDNARGSPIKVKCEKLRPPPSETGILPSPYPVSVAVGDFVFYTLRQEVFGGTITEIGEPSAYVHLYSPNRPQTTYKPAWWAKETDGVWKVSTRRPIGGESPQPVLHLVPLSDIVACGKIHSNGKLSQNLISQLHSRGVFASRPSGRN